jgi:hypothetical protein
VIVHGGTTPNQWTVASTDYHAKNGRVLRRDITITTSDTQLVLIASDAKRLASAIHLAAKNGDPA